MSFFGTRESPALLTELAVGTPLQPPGKQLLVTRFIQDQIEKRKRKREQLELER